ncbi:MAG: haloacid dehalogenase type II [Castellaniella sp.]|uniref:haloacid dehalogenase type II n=1 Tax=Castellaniella sp. TaxID=1955812 RepID=UPI0012243CEC|nr:haloacid dehalogenase type II [Castellaniella sp.]TAN26326.1 MAG: haloacid dehalogenase type II [Castellaniella sp.]
MPLPLVAVFDAYGTLFDVHSAVRRVAGSVGADAGRVSALWRDKQLEYSWTRSLMGRYIDFWQITEDALDYALATCGVDDAKLRGALLAAYRTLEPYPDVRAVLTGYHDLGIRTAVFSNATPGMLHDALVSAGLDTVVDTTFSTDALMRYKPDPEVYAQACKAFGVKPEAIVFHSSNAWDAAGAASFGWRTFWINRAHGTPEYTWANLDECSSLDAALARVSAVRRTP